MSFSHYEPCPKCRSRGNDTRGDNRTVYKDGGYHCFACGDHRSGRNPGIQALARRDVKEDNGTKGLPADFSREVPARAWKWLLQYGLGYRYWLPFVGWSEEHSRLVFTLSDFAIGRFIPDEAVPSQRDARGRYIPEETNGPSLHSGPNSSVAFSDRGGAAPRTPSKWFTYGNAHRTPQVIQPAADLPRPSGYEERLVLVEDVISAHKVGQLQICIPLFGTNIFDAIIPVIRHYRIPVTIWLDQDQQGTAQKKAANLSVLTGVPCSYVFTKYDPKSLSLEQIKDTLK